MKATRSGVEPKPCNYNRRNNGFLIWPLFLDSWASAAGDRVGPCPRIFIHGTDIVDSGLKVLFLGLFLLFFGLGIFWKRLCSAIFSIFLLFYRSFFCCPSPLEIFLTTPLLRFPWKFFWRRPCLDLLKYWQHSQNKSILKTQNRIKIIMQIKKLFQTEKYYLILWNLISCKFSICSVVSITSLKKLHSISPSKS